MERKFGIVLSKQKTGRPKKEVNQVSGPCLMPVRAGQLRWLCLLAGWILCVLLILGAPATAQAAVALVQSRSADIGNGNAVTLAFSSNVTAGNLIVVAATYGDVATDVVTSVTDTLGNTYTRVTNGWQVDAGGIQSIVVYYAKNILGGANTVTVNGIDGYNYLAIAIHEYSGLDTTAPFDVGAGQLGSPGSTAANGDVSTAATTTADGDLVFGAIMTTSANGTFTAGSAPLTFTEREEVTADGAQGLQTQDTIQTSAGSVEATWTCSSTSRYVAVMAAFKAGVAGCSNPTGAAGEIVYNADFNVAQYCNGTSWKAMGPMPGAGGAGCSNPARATGSLLYNTTFNVMQYCDGTNWKAMGPVPGAGGAGCSNPAGATGSMVFNVDAAVAQYCDGANWIQIGS